MLPKWIWSLRGKANYCCMASKTMASIGFHCIGTGWDCFFVCAVESRGLETRQHCLQWHRSGEAILEKYQNENNSVKTNVYWWHRPQSVAWDRYSRYKPQNCKWGTSFWFTSTNIHLLHLKYKQSRQYNSLWFWCPQEFGLTLLVNCSIAFDSWVNRRWQAWCSPTFSCLTM